MKQCAVPLSIIHLLRGTYIQESDINPNYLLVEDSQKVYLLNVVGVVVDIQKKGSLTNILIEDKTSQIAVRFFEEREVLASLSPGVVVLVVGRLRVYNQEKYISPEIVKPVSPLWLKVRSLLLTQKEKASSPLPSNSPVSQKTDLNETDIPKEKLLELIKQLDSGSGALQEEVIEKSRVKSSERILDQMIQSGDIFQITPGRIKVL